MRKYRVGQVIESILGLVCGYCGAEQDKLKYHGPGDWRCVNGCENKPRSWPTAQEKVAATSVRFRLRRAEDEPYEERKDIEEVIISAMLARLREHESNH